MTHRQVDTSITVKSESSTGKELTREQSNSFGASISGEYTATNGAVEIKKAVEFRTDMSFTSSTTQSTSVTYGTEKTDNIKCNDKLMGIKSASGEWTAW